MSNLFLQIFVGLCFTALIIVLFFEKADYLTYSFLIIIIAGVVSAIIMPEEVGNLEFFIEVIDWEVIIFLIGMFTIVEVLNEKQIFQELSRRIVEKYKTNIRKMFYFLCIVSTLVASFLEDLSVAIIFGPIIVMACIQLEINPTPFLLGMTICINIASTLTPFGSAEDVLIVNALDLDFIWFIQYFGIYFVITVGLTLFLLDKTMLKDYKNGHWEQVCEDPEILKHRIEMMKQGIEEEFDEDHVFYKPKYTQEFKLNEIKVEKNVFNRNIIGLVIFVVLLIIVPTLYLPCLISAIMFVFINPVKGKNGEEHPSISHYFKRVDYKLIYFFICLFVLVGLMEANGTVRLLENLISTIPAEQEFVVCVIILLVTSLLSGFMDNAPVTVIFLPIVSHLIASPAGDPAGLGISAAPVIIAFILGVNLGGNFLPQGSACDMMTLEIARENCVEDLTYKKLFLTGGKFAVLHIIIGIVYLAFIIFIF